MVTWGGYSKMTKSRNISSPTGDIDIEPAGSTGTAGAQIYGLQAVKRGHAGVNRVPGVNVQLRQLRTRHRQAAAEQRTPQASHMWPHS